MTSTTRRSPSSTARRSTSDWASERLPPSFDASMILASSSSVRPPPTSSTVSSRRSRSVTSRPAQSKVRIRGRNTKPNPRVNPVTTNATCSGRVNARRSGSSTPNIIRATSATSQANTSDTAEAPCSPKPAAVRAGRSNDGPTARSMRNPTSSVVSAIPNCAALTTKLRLVSSRAATRARRSPADAPSSTTGRRSDTSANSAATKNALAAINRTINASETIPAVITPGLGSDCRLKQVRPHRRS